MVSGDGLSYFFDGHHLFIKLVDPGNSETQVGWGGGGGPHRAGASRWASAEGVGGGTAPTPAPSGTRSQGVDFCRGGVCVRGYRYWSLSYNIRATSLNCGGAFCPMAEQVGQGWAVAAAVAGSRRSMPAPAGLRGPELSLTYRP